MADFPGQFVLTCDDPTPGNVVVNFGSPTGRTLLPSVFGFSGAGMNTGVSGNPNDFSTLLNSDFQTSAAKLKPALIRFNCQQTDRMFRFHIFPNLPDVSTPNWTVLDRWITNHAGFFNDTTGRLVFGIGPAFNDRDIAASTWAQIATLTAVHLRNLGQECFWWEVGNEPDGTDGELGNATPLSPLEYMMYYNAIATALHSVNANYKVGGPCTSFFRSDYNTPLIQQTGAQLGFLCYHTYAFNVGNLPASSAAIYQHAIDDATPQSARAALGNPNTPIFLGEYNMVLDGGNNASFDTAMYTALLLTNYFNRDPHFDMSAVWDFAGPNGGFACIANQFQGSDYRNIDPQGWYLGYAGQWLPGTQMSVSHSLPSCDILATRNGTRFAVQVINSGIGNAQTIHIDLTGATLSGQATLVRLSDTSTPVPIGLTSLDNIACVGPTILLISGNLV